jgi:hypothetical protein
MAGNGNDEGRRTGGQQQAIVRRRQPLLRMHEPALAVDFDDGVARVQRDAVVRIPGAGMQHDVVDLLVAGQQRREHDAVVVTVRFGPEHGDVIQVAVEFEQLFHRAHAGHAVADNDQRLLRFHRAIQTWPSATRAR